MAASNPPQELADRWQRVYPGIRTIPDYVYEIPKHGYELVDHFALPESFWWDHFYRPLEVRLAELREKYREDREQTKVLEKEQREVDLNKKYPGCYGSAFFVITLAQGAMA